MREQSISIHVDGATPPTATPGEPTLVRSGAVTDEKDTRYAGGISLAAALGGMLLGVKRAA